MTQSEGDPGFRVVDRRGTSDAADSDAAAPPPGASAQPGKSETAHDLPPVDFSTLVISLSTSVFHHLGLAPDPQGGPPGEKNLPLARQTIDLLEVLQAKTRGNLDRDEAALLESLLYELRMRFVEAGR